MIASKYISIQTIHAKITHPFEYTYLLEIILFAKISPGTQIVGLNSNISYMGKCLIFVMGFSLFLEHPKPMFNRCN